MSTEGICKVSASHQDGVFKILDGVQRSVFFPDSTFDVEYSFQIHLRVEIHIFVPSTKTITEQYQEAEP